MTIFSHEIPDQINPDKIKVADKSEGQGSPELQYFSKMLKMSSDLYIDAENIRKELVSDEIDLLSASQYPRLLFSDVFAGLRAGEKEYKVLPVDDHYQLNLKIMKAFKSNEAEKIEKLINDVENIMFCLELDYKSRLELADSKNGYYSDKQIKAFIKVADIAKKKYDYLHQVLAKIQDDYNGFVLNLSLNAGLSNE